MVGLENNNNHDNNNQNNSYKNLIEDDETPKGPNKPLNENANLFINN